MSTLLDLLREKLEADWQAAVPRNRWPAKGMKRTREAAVKRAATAALISELHNG